jgi:hypothetical protein
MNVVCVCVFQDVLSHAPDNMHFRTITELFPKGAAVFMLGQPHYASQGEVGVHNIP